ncbi:hypothetical protein FRY74_06165 [Vicingus serpentipes]|uniref:Uncharacterized protein n=1 Tax=Vicingus serpentipes TaxID=1926625 RepID=A0A5C6RVT7_9FLAO|nr:hypothetical protein [Vicingus serpentipes]TXB66154.1 hypothetical protein FRY74_06165 [Vicingus serpentipes]
MVLFIDKDFINDFFGCLDQSENRIAYLKVLEIFSSFVKVKFYINFETIEEHHNAVIENPLVEKLFDYAEFEGYSNDLVKDILFYNNKRPALAFTSEDSDWCFENSRGNLKICNIETFESVIKNILDLERKFDLLEDENSSEYSWNGWEGINYLSNYSNSIYIFDRYIFKKDDKDIIKENILEFIKTLVPEKSNNKCYLRIFSEVPENEKKIELQDELKLQKERIEFAKRFKTFLNSNLANLNISIELIIYDKKIQIGANLHDRCCFSSFYSIYVGKGFELYKKGRRFEKSNSRFIIESILDKFSYNSYNNNLNILDKYYDKAIEQQDVRGEMFVF